MPPLTDLEGIALAFIARSGPVTAYAVSKIFAESPSAFWTGSAGAIYPAMQRLAKRGLIRASDVATGRRTRTEYRITAKGRGAMKDWLLDAERAADIGFDPLRTRVVYLDLVSENERTDFLAAVAKQVDDNADRPHPTDDPGLQAIHAAVMRNRRAWVKTIAALITGPR